MNDRKKELIEKLSIKTTYSYRSLSSLFDDFAGDRKEDPNDFDLSSFETLCFLCSESGLPLEIAAEEIANINSKNDPH